MTVHPTITREHIGSPIGALRTALLGPDTAMRTRVRDTMTALKDLPTSGRTYAEHTARGPVLLCSALTGLGVPARALAAGRDDRDHGWTLSW